MCGIAGIFSSDTHEVTPELINRMTKSLRHRGPDDEGYVMIDTLTGRYVEQAGDDTAEEPKMKMRHITNPAISHSDLALGHRRLSIIDLSAAGHQPLSNEDEKIWIVHNGEVYNHIELREELKNRGHKFKSSTDTEVILHSYEEWGHDCLSRFNGMWAFAIWDSRNLRLFCSRDRFGIKPFYYYFDGIRFLFASEIKALLEADFVARKANYQTIFDYLAYGLQDCTEDTFFNGIKQLRGGYYLEFHPHENKFKIERYYNVPLHIKSNELQDDEYTRRFRELLEDSIRLRLISDVPLGTCLSGGLDSSSIVCVIDKLMRERGLKLPGTDSTQRTFSARFTEKGYDEGSFIDDVVRKTDVDAFYTYPTGSGLRKILPDLLWCQDEPYMRPQVYAQWEVYKLVKQSGVKVALDGQGGDELLGGYDIFYGALFSYLMRTFHWREFASEYYYDIRLRGKLAFRDLLIAAYHLIPNYVKPMVRGSMQADMKPCLNKEFAASFTGYPFRESHDRTSANFFDEYLHEKLANSYLPSILREQDRNSMAHSIESRVPFLDYRLVEFVFSLPWQQKIHQGIRKSILRNAMNGILPESVTNRQDKMGFPMPLGIWLREEMRDDVHTIINSQSFRQRPFFDYKAVAQQLKTHESGLKNRGATIWCCVNLELWLRMFIDGRGLASN